jgi:hypothetical protein
VRLTDVIDCLREKEVPEQIVRIIKELNTDTIARIKSNNHTSSLITITKGVRQADSLSPLLFSLIIYKIIANLPQELGYRMRNNPIHTICYTDDSVLIANSEENLQILLLEFDEMVESLNTEISVSKTKSLTTSRHNIKCEVKLRDTTIKQVPNFNWGLRYLLKEILSRS